MILDTLRKSDRDSEIIVNSAQTKSRVSLLSPNPEGTNPDPSPSHLRKEITIIWKSFQLQDRRKKPLSVMTSCQHSARNLAFIRDTDPLPAELGTWASAAISQGNENTQNNQIFLFLQRQLPHLSSQVLHILM